jgi:hypothetical protein
MQFLPSALNIRWGLEQSAHHWKGRQMRDRGGDRDRRAGVLVEDYRGLAGADQKPRLPL